MGNKKVNSIDVCKLATMDHEMSVADEANMRHRTAVCGGDFVSRLEYAKFLKLMEGNVAYATCLGDLAAALEFADDGSEAGVAQARKRLYEMVRASSDVANLKYHNYEFDVTLSKLPEYSKGKNQKSGGVIHLSKMHFFKQDAREIARLLKMTVEDVLLCPDASELHNKLLKLGLPDHPERLVFEYVYVPVLPVLMASGLTSLYDDLASGKEGAFDALYGISYEAGKNGAIRQAMEKHSFSVRTELVHALRYRNFNLPCFQTGGEFESATSYLDAVMA